MPEYPDYNYCEYRLDASLEPGKWPGPQVPFNPPTIQLLGHPGGNPVANLKSISQRCHPILVAFVWELTEETIDLPLGCLHPGLPPGWGGEA